VDGVQWLISLYENGLNGILADEMGLGKTLQVIAFFAHLWEKKVRGPFLVVAPLSTVGNWMKEFHKFAPEVPVVLYHGTKEERALMRRRDLKISGGSWKKQKKNEGLPVVVTSFEIAMNDGKMLAAVPWKYLAVDEGHRLKNKDSKLLRELKALHADNRLLLTGTPLQNNLVELWSLLNFILPDIFDSLETFRDWFDFDELLVGGASEGAAAKIMLQEEENRMVSKLHAIITQIYIYIYIYTHTHTHTHVCIYTYICIYI
jgi:ATP-dependent DNA helicase